jgi:hypothetical protein
MPRNPFKPTAGATPPLLIGRENTLELFEEGLDDGPGSPGLLTIFTGARGVGKTVMLTAAEDRALEHGWVCISETATAGIMGRLASAMQRHVDELGDNPPSRRITGGGIAGWTVTTQLPPERQVEWRELAETLLNILGQHQTGLLITIDEIQGIDRAELTQLAASVQHLIRDDQPIALVMAGLPKAVSDLLNEDVATFLRRADHIELRDVPEADVRHALATTFADTSVTISDKHLDTAAAATGGYPFLIQLVGYHVWRSANDGAVTKDSLTSGLEAAKRRLGSAVLATAIADLSDVDRTFLLKMSEDDGPSRIADIATRLGVTKQYASNYRQRLIDAGAIAPVGLGRIDFAIPYLRGWLREHAASVHRPAP